MEYPQEHIKPYGNDGKKSEQVEEMFDNIAPAYDKLNHTLSMGIDRSWRKKAIDTLRPFSPRRIMDVATGTGDFAILACRELQPDMLIGTDISEGMMNVGREKVKQAHLSDRISFAREDCTSLSFADESFDAVTVAFGIRNFDGLDKGLSEMCPRRRSPSSWAPMRSCRTSSRTTARPTLATAVLPTSSCASIWRSCWASRARVKVTARGSSEPLHRSKPERLSRHARDSSSFLIDPLGTGKRTI